jgi:NAD(P) transhydrogenase subunit beta
VRFAFEFLYLLAAVLFIVGLKFLSTPARARQGNSLAAFGMLVATVTLLAGLVLNPEGGPPRNLGLIVAAIGIGAIAGAVGARRVAMTDMPQMVAILNGCGGGSAALISTAEFLHLSTAKAGADTMFGTIIGSISLSGSVVAFAKLQGLVSEKAINSPVQKAVNALLFLGCWAWSACSGSRAAARRRSTRSWAARSHSAC